MPVFLTLAKLVKYFLQLIASSNDDTDIYSAQIEKKSKVVKISIKERVFVIPLYLQSHSVLETINFVRWGVIDGFINSDTRLKAFLRPTEFIEMTIKLVGNG